MKNTLFVLASIAALPLVAGAQKPVSQAEMITVNATIDAIDRDSRLVLLRNEDGDVETVYCGPGVKRFDELKVGDTVTFRYYESTVYMIRKPGRPSGLPATSGERAVVPGAGARPGGTVSRQQTATVTVTAIDPKLPSVTVLKDGDQATFKIKDRKNLDDLKVGDTVEITYTQAIMISVK